MTSYGYIPIRPGAFVPIFFKRISRLRSEKTGELDPANPTVVPPSTRTAETPSEQVKKVGGELVNQQQDTPPFSGNSGAIPQGPLTTDGSGEETPRPLQTSTIA